MESSVVVMVCYEELLILIAEGLHLRVIFFVGRWWILIAIQVIRFLLKAEMDFGVILTAKR